MRSRVWAIGASLTIAVLVSWPARSRGQDAGAGSPGAPTRELSQAPVAELTNTLRQAVEAYDRGDLATARELFEIVHARAPTARTLRSLGLLAFREGRFEDSVALLEASLASEVKPLTPAQLEGASTVLREARAKVPQEQSETAHAGSSRLVPTPPSSLPPTTASSPQPSAAPIAKPIVPAPVQGGPRSSGKRLRRLGYAMLGIAGAAIIVGSTSYLTGLSRVRDIEDHCRKQPDGRCTLSDVRGREDAAHIESLAALSVASAIIAGLAGSGGTAILIWQRQRAPDLPASTRIGIGWRTTF